MAQKISGVSVLRAVRSLSNQSKTPFKVGDVCKHIGFESTKRNAGLRERGPTNEGQFVSCVLRGLHSENVIKFQDEWAPSLGYEVSDNVKLDHFISIARFPFRKQRTDKVAMRTDDHTAPPSPASAESSAREDIKTTVVEAAALLTVSVVIDILKSTAGVQKASLIPPERYEAVVDTLRWHMKEKARSLRVENYRREVSAKREAEAAKSPVTREEMARLVERVEEAGANAVRRLEERQHKFEQTCTAALNQHVDVFNKELRSLAKMMRACDVMIQGHQQHIVSQHTSLNDARERITDLELSNKPDPTEQEIAHARMHDARHVPQTSNGFGGY